MGFPSSGVVTFADPSTTVGRRSGGPKGRGTGERRSKAPFRAVAPEWSGPPNRNKKSRRGNLPRGTSPSRLTLRLTFRTCAGCPSPRRPMCRCDTCGRIVVPVGRILGARSRGRHEMRIGPDRTESNDATKTILPALFALSTSVERCASSPCRSAPWTTVTAPLHRDASVSTSFSARRDARRGQSGEIESITRAVDAPAGERAGDAAASPRPTQRGASAHARAVRKSPWGHSRNRGQPCPGTRGEGSPNTRRTGVRRPVDGTGDDRPRRRPRRHPPWPRKLLT
jgi:hypothetical protein